MFNIYYINYAKAYEIAMLLDNKIIEEITKERNTEGGLTGTAETGTGGMTEISLVGKYLPKLSLNGELTGSKSSKVIDTVEEQQQEVLDSYLLWTIPIGTEITEDIVGVKCDSFFDMLSVNARLFEVVRYKHEYSTIVFHDGYIHFLAKALKGVCEELNIDRE